MAKKNFKKSNQFGKDKKVNQEYSENAMEIAEKGEIFGDSIISILSLTATEWTGIGSATYGLAKAWAALKAVAKKQNIEVVNLFKMLVESFSIEFEETIKETEL